MKHILTVDVQKKDEEFIFSLHMDKKITVLHFKTMSQGFIYIQEFISDKRTK